MDCLEVIAHPLFGRRYVVARDVAHKRDVVRPAGRGGVEVEKVKQDDVAELLDEFDQEWIVLNIIEFAIEPSSAVDEIGAGLG